MYFEMQLSAAAFTQIVRNRIKAIPLCINREFVDEDGQLTTVKGSVVVVDHVEIGPLTSIQREKRLEKVPGGIPREVDAATHNAWIFSPTNYTSFEVPYMQVRQQLDIHLVKATDLEANGPNPTPAFRTLTVYAAFNVALIAGNQTQGGGPLSLIYELAYIDYGVLALFLSDKQQADIQQEVNRLKLPSTTLDLSPLSAMLRRPVAAINAGIVCDEDGSFVVLRADIEVYKTPIAVTSHFFLDPPENLLQGRAWAMLVDADLLKADARRQAHDALTGEPSIRLNSGPDVGWDPSGPALDIDAEVELVDACPFFIDDIDMDAHVDIRYSFSVPTPNTMRTHFYLNGSPSNVVEEIACALTGALLWPFIGPLFLKGENLGVGIGAYFAGLVASPLARFIGLIAAIETKTLSKDISKNLGSTCAKQDDENYECNEPMNLVMQLSPGMNSRLEVEAVYGVARGLVLTGSISGLGEFFQGSINSVSVCQFAWGLQGRCTGSGQNNFRFGNQASISVGAVPPASLCNARILYDPLKEFKLTREDNSITIAPAFKPAYVADPYPCKVRLITNRGVRIITLNPPREITQAETDHLEETRMRAIASCYHWERHHTPVEKVHWLVDPPPFEIAQSFQFWQVVVRGMQPEETIHVTLPDGPSLLNARPSRAGLAHFALMFGGAAAPPELALALTGRGDGDDEGLLELTLQQLLFAHQASLPVSGPPLMMRLDAGGRRLLIEDESWETAWDLSTPLAPALLHSLPLPEARQRDTLNLHNGNRVTLEPSENLLRALEMLRDRFGEVAVAGSPRVGGVAESLYVRTREQALLFDIANLEELRLVHEYDGPAWFEHTTLAGKVLARYDERLRSIEIYVAILGAACA